MPCILNVKTGLSHMVTQVMWEDVWKEKIEKNPKEYKLMMAPSLRVQFDEDVPNMGFSYIEDLIAKSKSPVKRRGRPKKV